MSGVIILAALFGHLSALGFAAAGMTAATSFAALVTASVILITWAVWRVRKGGRSLV